MGYKGYIISASADINNPMGIYRDIPSWQTDNPVHKTQDEASAKAWIDAQYTLAKLGEPMNREEIKLGDSMTEIPISKEGYVSTPSDAITLFNQLSPYVQEEYSAYYEYESLAESAYNLGRPDIAEKLRMIAEDEWRHNAVIKGILDGLRPQ